MTFVLAALLAAAPVILEADPNHSTVGFSVKHMVATTVRGQFTKFSSTVAWNKEDPAKSSIELKVDPSSINTNNEKRDGHLSRRTSSTCRRVRRCRSGPGRSTSRATSTS